MSTRLRLIMLLAAVAPCAALLNGCATGVAIAPLVAPKAVTPKAAPANTTTATTASGAIVWQPTYDQAWSTAYTAKKPVMIDFYATWCGPCKMMDSETFPNASVIQTAAQFTNVKVDVDQNPKLAQQYKISGIPTVVWLDNRGQIIHTISGYYAPAEFVQEMNVAKSKFTPLS